LKERSKRYKEAEKFFDRNNYYPLKEAISILKKIPNAKFDETIEIILQLNIDPKKSDQMVRGTVILPYGTGKTLRIAVFCKSEKESEAKKAGADFVGSNDLIEKVSKGFLDFDVVISTPDMMKDLSRLGKILGPRGLMPSPKTGTVTQNIEQAIKEIKRGKIEFKVDKLGSIHLGIGKISFKEDQIYENAIKVIDTVQSTRPSSIKGNLIKRIWISKTMSPGVKVKI